MSLENQKINHSKNFEEKKEKTIEEQANYEGNHSLLLFERLKNKDVFTRLVNDLYNDITSVDYSTHMYVDPDYLKSLERDEYSIKQDIKIELEQALDRVSKSTEIGFSEYGYIKSESGSNGTGYVEICNGKIGNTFNETVLVKNITESHEKGHNIRKYNADSEFTKDLQSMFDFDKIILSNEEVENIRKIDSREDSKEAIERKTKEYIAYPWEIIERMSQIKNYFGFSSNEIFTQAHLDYVRKNYIKDTGMNSIQIKPFFDAISDDKKFIDKMNKLGI